jgi:endonuclease YncB( thermonuclease family)
MVAIGLTAAAALIAGCGGGSEDAGAETTVPDPLSCTSSAGIEFLTVLDSCDAAFSRGRRYAADLGLATQPDSPAAETAMATTCRQIQGTEQQTYTVPEIGELAEKLNSSGVCRGSVELLVLSSGGPPTTAPGEGLVATSGWTLVEIVDGDTLDITSAVEGQRRIQLIGANAPEPGECMAEQAASALRFMAADKELRIVPDVTDANEEGNNLRYLDQLDGVDLGGTLIDLGLAIADPVEPDIARAADYAQRMANAQSAGVGMWAPGACPPPSSTTPATTAGSG